MLRYNQHKILIKEIPDEISLGISISGCNIKCKDCHSKHTWNEDYGIELSLPEFYRIVYPCKKLISCILFLGGETKTELKGLIYASRSFGKKVALYSGRDLSYIRSMGLLEPSILDFIKVGYYNNELGGLDSPTTNQRLYEIKNGELNDITYKFRRTNNRPENT